MDYIGQQDIWVLAAILVWVLPIKGFAMWRAAKLDHKKWFAALLAVNFMGALELSYLLFYNKRKGEKATFLTDFIKRKLRGDSK